MMSNTPMQDAPRGLTISVNDPWLDELTEDQARGYVTAVVSAAEASEGKSHPELVEHLRAGMSDGGVELPDQSLDVLAEQLHASDASSLNIVTNSGRVLYGTQEATASNHDPDIAGAQDPEHPDRPAYS